MDFQNNNYTGAFDDQTEEQKLFNYNSDELFAGSGTVEWKPIEISSAYPLRFQSTSLSCVAQTGATLLGIDNLREEGRFINFSASDPYQRRINNTSGGMGINDAGQIFSKTGATFEHLMPSQNMGEHAINSVARHPSDEQIGKIFKAGNYVHTPFNIDRIAQVMEQNKVNGIVKPLMVWFLFYYDELGFTPTIKHSKGSGMIHHSMTCINYGLINGHKSLLVQESAMHETTFNGLRAIKEDFIKERMTASVYFTDLSNLWREVTDASVGAKIDLRGVVLPLNRDNTILIQNALKIEGFFPQEQTSTGFYGGITRGAVVKFQRKYNLLDDGKVGRHTLAKMVSLYS